MFTIALISQKGNQGKSVIALSVAVVAAKVGLAVVIIDVDPQATAANWKDRREADSPVVVTVPVSRLRQALDAADASGADWVIIDSPGMNQSGAIDCARAGDLVLVPTSADPIVMETLPTVRNLVRAAGDPPAFVVFNFIHPQGNRIADALKANTPAYCGLPACPVHLSQRNVYKDAPAYGKAPQELEPDSPATAEIERLYMFICEHVNTSPRSLDHGSSAKA